MSARDHAAMSSRRRRPHLPVPRGRGARPGASGPPRGVEDRPVEEEPDLGELRAAEAAAVIAEALDAGSGWLGMEPAARLLDCYGLPVPEWRVVADPVAAGHAAEELGGTRGAEGRRSRDPPQDRRRRRESRASPGARAVSGEAAQMDEALERSRSPARAVHRPADGRGRRRVAGRGGRATRSSGPSWHAAPAACRRRS